ncbi:MAG: type II toxin-antitoxin system HicB family antitoxin [Clostridiales Family XIII bacterium]|jgi:predicted RNase H-like HicB family nuclease|nr:type II toxin-antitoxin system HicB family antitoxin [Clostridiales Family XIII bacterium]
MSHSFTALIEKDPESGRYVGIVPGIAGAHTEAETLDELHEKLTEVLELCLSEMDFKDVDMLPMFVGAIQIEAHI